MVQLYHLVSVKWCRCPVAVPGVRLADGAAALHTDRCHSLGSLHLPPAALPSLPQLELRSSWTDTGIKIWDTPMGYPIFWCW